MKVRINRVGNPCLNGGSCLGIALTVMNVACERRCISAVTWFRNKLFSAEPETAGNKSAFEGYYECH